MEQKELERELEEVLSRLLGIVNLFRNDKPFQAYCRAQGTADKLMSLLEKVKNSQENKKIEV